MRIVIKIGSNALTNDAGRLNEKVIAGLTNKICQIMSDGHNVVLITSGAVSTGRSTTTIDTKLIKGGNTVVKQLLASVGQPRLMQCYAESFDKNEIDCAQILLTRRDFEETKRSNRLHRLIDSMLKIGIVPVINENDALSSEELKNTFADNDHLAALVSILIGADKLIVLTDVDGFFDGPVNDHSSKVVPVIKNIDGYINVVDDSTSNGCGGMTSKLRTAKLVTNNGINMHIGNGKKPHILFEILKGSAGTFFPC